MMHSHSDALCSLGSSRSFSLPLLVTGHVMTETHEPYTAALVPGSTVIHTQQLPEPITRQELEDIRQMSESVSAKVAQLLSSHVAMSQHVANLTSELEVVKGRIRP